MGGIW
jgi:hypothetical protein